MRSDGCFYFLLPTPYLPYPFKVFRLPLISFITVIMEFYKKTIKPPCLSFQKSLHAYLLNDNISIEILHKFPWHKKTNHIKALDNIFIFATETI